MILYLSKYKLARVLLLLVILIATFVIFPIPVKETAKEVICVIAGNKRLPIYAVETSEKIIAISFDATWGNTRTPQILQILQKYEIKTTFFLTNIWVKQYPELAAEIKKSGHEIGLHSANHPNLTELTESKIKEELLDNAKLIQETTGYKPVLFRPPFGAYNNLVINLAEQLNFTPIQWSVDSLDWKDLTAEAIYHRVTTKIHPGAIVLFHNDGTNTPEALVSILDFFQKEGYRVVPISELLYEEDYGIDHRGFQFLK